MVMMPMMCIGNIKKDKMKPVVLLSVTAESSAPPSFFSLMNTVVSKNRSVPFSLAC
jgi:hypothetical protein